MPTDDIDVEGQFGVILPETLCVGEAGECSTCQRYEGHEETVIDEDVFIVYCSFGNHGKTHYTNIHRPLCGQYIEKLKGDA